MLTRYFFIICCFVSYSEIYAQLDSEHYLPPLRQGKNNQAIKEQTIYISSPEAGPFDVEVTIGTGNPTIISGVGNGTPQEYTLNEGNNDITLTTDINTGIILQNSGLHFKSTSGQKFYVNWRGRSQSQAGSLTCKGRKALGRDFRWGGIPNTATHETLSSSLGLMATENGTVVVINNYDPNCEFRNGNDTGGHTQNEFVIPLEKGETFVLEAYRDQAPTANDDGWIGAKITSNNPIATSMGGLNVGVIPDGLLRDVGIDQPVPTNVLGREYVFIRGNGIDATEFPIIVGTQNGTEIRVNGILLTTINDGEYFLVPGSNYSDSVAGASMYIETTKDAYAFQCLAGKKDANQTIGMNFIAPVNCLLPSLLSEIPAIDEVAGKSFENGLSIIASTDTSDSAFTITEDGVNIGPITSTNVPGTTKWKSFYIVGLTGRITVSSTGGGFATGLFMTDNLNAGVAGYFSGFDTVPNVDLNVTGGGCFPGLGLEEISGAFDSYQWFKDESLIIGATSSSYTPTGVGDFYVRVSKAGCFYNSRVLSTYYCAPDINVIKTANKQNLEEGDEVEFTIKVTNLGIDSVTNLKITDALPPPLSLVSATTTRGTFTSPEWYLGTMTSGETQSINIVATALVGTEGKTVVNVVKNTQDQVDTNRTLDDLVEALTITDAEIRLTKEAILDDGEDNIVNVGDIITYTFKVTNHGEVPLKNILLLDPLLKGIITVLPTGDTNGNSELDTTEEWVYIINYSITQSDINSGIITNIATVQGEQPNGSIQLDLSDDPSNTSDIDSNADGEPDDPTITTLPESPKIGIIKTGILVDNGDGLQIGDYIDYTLTVTNEGNILLENIVVNDPLLGGNIIGPVGGDLNSNSKLDISEQWVYKSSYYLTKTDLDAGEIVNTATASADSVLGTQVFDISDDPTIISLGKSDLSLTIDSDISKSIVGQTVVFTLQLSNQSLKADLTSVDATNIQVRNVLPVGYTYVDHVTSLGTYSSDTGIWTITNLSKEQTISLVITVTINTPTEAADEYLHTTEIIAADQYDPDSNVLLTIGEDDLSDGIADDDEDDAITTLELVNLSIEKTIDNNKIQIDNIVTFSIKVSNSGPSEATNISVEDKLPIGYTYLNHSGGIYNHTSGIWEISNLEDGATITLMINAVVNPPTETIDEYKTLQVL